MGYWKWLKETYLSHINDLLDYLVISAYLASIACSFIVPFVLFVVLLHAELLPNFLVSLLIFVRYFFFSYTYIDYRAGP